MLARNDSGGRDRFFLRAIIGELCFRGYSSAELLSNIIYTSLDDFLSEISEVSYTLIYATIEQAGERMRI